MQFGGLLNPPFIEAAMLEITRSDDGQVRGVIEPPLH